MAKPTTAEVEAAFESVPTLNLAEVVRVALDGREYDAQVLLTFADGSRNLAYTNAEGTVRIIRFKADRAA